MRTNRSRKIQNQLTLWLVLLVFTLGLLPAVSLQAEEPAGETTAPVTTAAAAAETTTEIAPQLTGTTGSADTTSSAGTTGTAAADTLTPLKGTVASAGQVNFLVENNTVPEASGAAWFGSATAETECTVLLQAPLTAPFKLNDVIAQLAAEQGLAVQFTDAERSAIRSIKGLSAGLTLDYNRVTYWTVTLNNTEITSALGDVSLKSGDVVLIDYRVKSAADVSHLPALSAYWPSFRGNEQNSAVRALGSLAPTDPEKCTLSWSKTYTLDPVTWIGSPGDPIIVNDRIYVVHGNVLEMLSLKDGQSLGQVTLPGDQSYGAAAPVYGDGIIFVSLSDLTMMAYRADNLALLWGVKGGSGRPIAPLSYKNHVVYGAYYNDKSGRGEIVAFEAESGNRVWRRYYDKGVYWTGALVTDKWFIHGDDEGYVDVDNVVSGEQVSRFKMSAAVRSTVMSDGSKYYIADKNGQVLCFSLNDDGSVKPHWQTNVGSSVTATMVAHNGRLYVASQDVKVLNTSDGKVLRSLSLPYPAQGSPLLLTGEGGQVYVYLTCNHTPGALYMFTDKPGQTDNAAVTTLYTPPAELQNYCLGSPIMLPDGRVMYRNDSATLFVLSKGEKVQPTPTPSAAPTPGPTPGPTATAAATTVPAVVPEESTVPEQTSVPAVTAGSETGTSTAETGTTAPETSEAPAPAETTVAPTAAADQTAAPTTAPAVPRTGEGGGQWLIAVLLLGTAAILAIVVIVIKRKSKDEPSDLNDK